MPEGLVAAALLAGIVAIGGAGVAYPLLATLVELLSLGLLAHVLTRRDGRPVVTGGEWLLLAVLVATPLLQLMPLPFDWWTALPGRAVPRAVLAAIGVGPVAMPLSLTPAATRGGALALLPGIACFFAARAETAAGRRTLARTVLLMAGLSAVLGAAQVALGSAAPGFRSAHAGQAIGLFVNRNHQAALLLLAICLAPAALRRPGARRVPPMAFALAALFAAAVVATTSRTALLLLPVCLLPTLWPAARRSPRWALGVVATIVALTGVAWWQGSLPRLLDRFGAPELRPDIWRTSWAATQTYFPAGAGIGAFKAVYPLAEQRAALTPFVVNHAHNEYLELLIEGGAVAALGLALFAVWVVRRSLAARAASVRGLAPAALGSIAVLLAWSTVDYPLRTLALTAVFGLLSGLAGETPRRATGGRWRLALLPVLALVALGTVADGLTRHRLLDGEAQAAAPETTLASTPLDQHALAQWSLARQRAGDAAAARGWDAVARLGWRDPLAQVMLFARDADRGAMASAVASADALLRQGQFDPTLLTLLRVEAGDPRFAPAMAATLAADPPWRAAYLTRLADLNAAGVSRHATLLRAMLAAHRFVRADEVAALVARAAAVGRDDVAQQGWAMLVGRDLLGDPALARIDATPRARAGIAGWHRTALPGLDPEITGALQLDRAAAGALLYQDLFLAPGRYVLTAVVRGDAPLDAATVHWTATCARGDERLDDGALIEGAGSSRLRTSVTFAVPVGCVRQRLALDGGGDGFGPAQLRVRLALTAR